MRVLSLFSGIGAHDLGLVWAGMTIVGQVEIDDYCRSILGKHWPDVPKWNDITKTTVDDIRSTCGRIDLITGGFPCVDISTAGKGAGIYAPRSGLFWEMLRIIEGIHPTWLLIENVPALRIRGGDDVLLSLEKCGYTCEPVVVGAVDVGAAHRRNRVWIVAHANSDGRNGIGISGIRADNDSSSWRDVDGCSDKEVRSNPDSQPIATIAMEGGCAVVASESVGSQPGSVGVGTNTNGARREGEGWSWPGRFALSPYRSQHDWEYPRTTLVPVGRSIHGTTRRMAIKAIGNSNPPQVVALIGKVIMRIDKIYEPK